MRFSSELFWATLSTIELAGLCIVLSSLIALLAGLALMSPNRYLRGFVRTYVEVVRGTSLVVQLFWLYFVLPELGIILNGFTVGIIGLSLNGGAYGADVFRSAFEAVPRGQSEAAYALCMPRRMALWTILTPQALVRLIPPWSNAMIDILKGTSIFSMIGIYELTFASTQLNATLFQPFKIFLIVAAIYLVLSQIIARSMFFMEGVARRRMGLR
ncbi:amino acid ABC transporter permease [Pararhizobium sp. YC-54]|uniref:amino acid ABC transporter permease n=1 Tax=Pararhizobium sp. YC-54 TaxID=2986920 RepID=UPI0021F71823|nr:amino acid ABC transporter permease [Pararhizobium sp. YC-54]MCW0001870.1 amino acid ABC transporter permease [Pararhizobium sp. YC-54]